MENTNTDAVQKPSEAIKKAKKEASATVAQPVKEAILVPEEPKTVEVPEEELGTSEKVVEQKKEKSVKPSDITIQVCAGTREELEQEIIINADKFQDTEALTDNNSYILKLAGISESALISSAATFINEVLDQRDATFAEAESKSSHGGRFSTNLTGTQATMAFTAKLQGYKKVYLPNSGFHVTIRPWTMGELSAFFQSIDTDDKELGRLMGYWRFTIHDAFIKGKFMELFPSCVINSNLKSWANGDTLERSISMHDYDSLVWAVCSLMYKEAITLNVLCMECKSDSSSDCDISKMQLINNNVLNKEAMQFLYDDAPRDQKDILRYKQELIAAHETIKIPVTLSGVAENSVMEYELTVPSIAEYLVNAKRCIADVIAASNGVSDIKNKELLNQTIISFSRGYIPWLTRLALTVDGELAISTSDRKTFPSILESLGYDDANANTYDEIYKFMRDSNACAIGYTPPTCDSCGNAHKTESGYVAWDAEKLFFDLIYLKLISQGLDMT